MARLTAALLLALCTSTTQAFFAPHTGRAAARSSTAFRAIAEDITAAEQEAIRLTKEKGARSPEAVNAWETYEELASADNSVASKPGLDEACEVSSE